jgi:hypothetical protein
MARDPHIEVVRVGDRYWWRLVGANGEIAAHSQPYTRWNGAKRAGGRWAKRFGLRLVESAEA